MAARFFTCLMTATLLVAPALSVASPFTAPVLWNRGSDHSTYQEWDQFQVLSGQTPPDGFGAHSPDVGVHTVEGGSPTLEDLSETSIVTSTKNLYSFAAPLDIKVAVPNYGLGEGYRTTVVLQTKTAGKEIDPATLRIGDFAPSFGELLKTEEIQTPRGISTEFTSWYRWDLPSDPGNAASYDIRFVAQGSSMSLMNLAVDTWTGVAALFEPIPGTELLAGDANGDGIVDLSDFILLKANFGDTDAARWQGEFNGDAKVDLADFIVLKANFGQGEAAAAVPEPATAGLAVLGFAILLAAYRRRTT